MKNKLFLICPAAKVEPFLRQKYGENSFFLTALGAAFNLNEQVYAEELATFLEREAIEEVVVVNDTSCCFIHRVVAGQKGFGTYADEVLIELLLDHYVYVMESPSEIERKTRLAELNVQRQLVELLENDYIRQQGVMQQLAVKGLVTDRTAGKAREVQIQSSALSVWI
jgi:carbonic anhydrase